MALSNQCSLSGAGFRLSCSALWGSTAKRQSAQMGRGADASKERFNLSGPNRDPKYH
jgi:hypothetical protein